MSEYNWFRFLPTARPPQVGEPRDSGASSVAHMLAARRSSRDEESSPTAPQVFATSKPSGLDVPQAWQGWTWGCVRGVYINF